MNRAPDLKHPNRRINIGVQYGGVPRRPPQLVWHTQCNHPDHVQSLLEAGAKVDLLSDTSESALLFSLIEVVNHGDRRSFDLLKQHPHSHETMNMRTDKLKLTILLKAIETGQPDIVETVLGMGAEVDRRGDTDDQTALNLCIKLLGILKKTADEFISECRQIKPDDPVLIESARRSSHGMLGITEREAGRIISKRHNDPLHLLGAVDVSHW
ncbi:hypothetical protein GCM10023116_18980 [Kistimonas scapharcae]|uniref:Ankyrin n=2 Tax=Kistimonas scapharcae TaxID=1036133 RepID=A0ABP8V425_9GAMM